VERQDVQSDLTPVAHALCQLRLSRSFSHPLCALSRSLFISSGHVTLPSLTAYLASAYQSAGGVVHQTPPLFSALKQNGARLSQLARQGLSAKVDLEAKTRPVHVYSIRVVEFEPPFYTLDITCGSGFYVRSLVRDIGAHFQCGSTLLHLVRTQQSGFTLESAHVLNVDDMVRPTKTGGDIVGSDAEASSDASADQRTSLPFTPAAPSFAAAPPYAHLPCTRENVIRVLSIPLERRRVSTVPRDDLPPSTTPRT
jgi:hypothetical protein